VFFFATTLLTSAALGASADRADTLYARLGGDAVITAVVNETVEAVAADARVNQSFDKVDMKRLKKMIVEQICALSDGPCRYTGDDMQKSHAGLKIREGEFVALVEALRASLDSHNVGTREKNELVRLLAPMKRDVVTR
jgi:hemoglobin